MAEKKTNEILEAQRKARQSFLDLKKMQSGEMDAGPKPSEVAEVLTPKQKFANFWHYSKWYVLSTVALTALIAFMVVQCATKPSYDLKLVYFTYTPSIDEQTSAIADYLEPYCEDVNGDGETNIQVINCSVSNDNSNVMTRNATLQKLYSIIVAEESAVLFITDEESAKYFDGMTEGKEDFFSGESAELKEDFYKATENETFGNLPEGLTLSVRRVDGTLLEKQKDAPDYYQVAQKLVANLNKADN